MYHDEKVTVRDECGDEDIVYRYLRMCKRCSFYDAQDGARRGHCRKFQTSTSPTRTTCPDFLATEISLGEMWHETKARDGVYAKIIYKGVAYYVEHEDLYNCIGFVPECDQK